MKELGQADVSKLSGRWPKTGGPFKAPATVSSILVRSAGNGRATAGGYIAETPIETRVAPAGGPALAAGAAPAGGAPPPPSPQRRARARAVQEDELSLFMAVPKQPLLIQATRGAAEPVTMSDPSRFDRATRIVTPRRGETVSFAVRDERQEAAGRAYELTFPNRAQAEAAFEFGTPGAPMQVSGTGLTTGQLQAPGVVATLRVRAAATPGARIPVAGVVDGQRIEATFVIEP